MAKIHPVIALLAVILTACGDSAQPQALPTATFATTISLKEQPMSQPLSPAQYQPWAQLVDRAKADLAKQLSVAAADIKVLAAEAVTWPDGSLGCPQPGMMYTQALVAGYFIRLQVGQTIANYHGGGQGEPFRCASSKYIPGGGRSE